MKMKQTLLIALSVASFGLLFSASAFADPCTDAIAAAAKEINDKGGTCKQKSNEFKTAVTRTNRICSKVRNDYRYCWAVYRVTEKNCNKRPKVSDRIKCRNAAASKRNACRTKIRNSEDKKMCSDRRKYAAKCGFKTAGACGAPALGAYRTCTAHWVGVFLKAFLGS